MRRKGDEFLIDEKGQMMAKGGTNMSKDWKIMEWMDGSWRHDEFLIDEKGQIIEEWMDGSWRHDEFFR
jgi:glutathione peroxidase-family protein